MKSNAAVISAPIAKENPRTRHGFCQRLVLRAFEQMRKGGLLLELPDGSKRLFGLPNVPATAHIRVVDTNFFRRCVFYGDVGFGEAYVAGEWETNDLASVISWFILNIDDSPSMSGATAKKLLFNCLGMVNRARHWLRANSVNMSRRNISDHYDLGNDFYKLFLDSTMTYSSALFTSREQTLEQAQTAKYERLCQQLRLRPSDRVLEIGGGWGGFGKYAATHYGAHVTSVTISEEQFNYVREMIEREGLGGRVKCKLLDYRNLSGSFDKIISIEMLEAVGDRYLEAYFAKCHELLKPDGLLALQMITCPDSRYDELRRNVDWIQKHIFPGSLLLSVHRVNTALRRTGDLFLHDLSDLGLSYAETLRRWRASFNERKMDVQALGFDENFVRKWNYYLSYCEAAFAMRNITVVQAIYTRPNNPSLAME